jgi:Cft2 family RNA processing exonuclease
MSTPNTIDISFLGGATSIGASCTLVRVAGRAFVVDCGVRYSGSSPLPDLSMLADTRVDAILMTHAHMDHSGGNHATLIAGGSGLHRTERSS